MDNLDSFVVEKISFYKDRISHAIGELWFCEDKIFALLKDHCYDCNRKSPCWNDRFGSLCMINGHCINRKIDNVDMIK